MESVFFVVIGTHVMVYGLNVLGSVSAKAAGVSGLATAVALLVLLAWQPVGPSTNIAGPTLTALMVGAAFYGAAAAGVFLYGVEERYLGWLGVALGTFAALIGIYLLIGDYNNPASISYYGGAAVLVLAAVALATTSALLLKAPYALPKRLLGWLSLVGGLAVVFLGGLPLVGAYRLAA